MKSFLSDALKKPECIICYTPSGKNSEEEIVECGPGGKTMSYPIINFSYAYGCNCKTSFAHNRCLKNIFKCPTCRKSVEKPCLRVHSYGKITLEFSLGWIEKNPVKFKNIVKLFCTLGIIIIIISILQKHAYVKINGYIQLIFSIILVIAFGLIQTNDYVNKYWLFDEESKTFY